MATSFRETLLTDANEAERLIWQENEWAEKERVLVHREQELEAGRSVAKIEAIRRIMAGPNPFTGKPHSYSSAEEQVGSDEQYAAYLKQLRDTVLEKNAAEGQRRTTGYRIALQLAMIARDKGAA